MMCNLGDMCVGVKTGGGKVQVNEKMTPGPRAYALVSHLGCFVIGMCVSSSKMCPRIVQREKGRHPFLRSNPTHGPKYRIMLLVAIDVRSKCVENRVGKLAGWESKCEGISS